MKGTLLKTLSAIAIVSCAGLAACDRDGGGNFAQVGTAVIEVAPQELVFDAIGTGESQSLSFQVINSGTSELIINDWEWEGNFDEFSLEGLDDLRVAAGDAQIVSVTYTPTDADIDDAFIVINNNSQNRREARVHVLSQGQSAYIAARPDPVYISAERVGETVTVPLELYNVGNEPFLIDSLSLATATGEIGLLGLPDTLPHTIGVQDALNLEVTYTPTGGGEDMAELVVGCDAENCDDARFFVSIEASMLTPYLIVSPISIGFGAVPIGETVTAELFARNEGQSTLFIDALEFAFTPGETITEITIDNIDGQPFDASDPTWEIPAGGNATITLAYTPEDTLVDAETLLIRSNDPEFPVMQIPVGGSAAVPALEVIPQELYFGRTAVGYPNTLDLIIRNGGTEDLELAGIEQRGNDVFVMENLGAMPASLGAGEQFVLEVTFDPVTANVDYSGSLIISAPNDPDSPEALVPMQGTGDAEPDCELSVVPITINFGVVPRGTLREGTATIINNGSGPCRVTRVEHQSGSIFPIPIPGFGNDYFDLVSVTPFIPTPASPLILSAGQSMVITASYFPQSVTELSEAFGDAGSVSVTAVDDISGEVELCGNQNVFGFPPPPPRDCGVNLQARSAIASVGAVPGNIDFGLVTIGCNSQDQEVRIYNTGTASVNLTGAQLEDCTGEFALAGVPVFPVALGPGASSSVRVRYAPTGPGEDACRLVITSDSETDRLTVPLRGEGTQFSHQVDEFEQVTGREVDVLFVVDNSGSMSEEQNNLANNFASFVNAATAWDTEFQLGVVTTQVDGSVSDPTGGSREPGELLGNPRIITPATPGFQAAFERTVRVGSNGSGTESGLEAARMALSDPVITDLATDCADCAIPYTCQEGANGSPAMCGGYNRSFLRDNASLEIIFVSDEEDQSRASLAFYEDFFRNIKGFRNDALFHVSAIVGPRGGCSTSNGSADAGQRYLDLATSTGGGAGSICDANFSTTLAEIGERAFGLRVQFFLSRVPDPSTIEVRVEGANTPTGWTYDAESNGIIWDEAVAPQPGETFEVEYDAACF